MAKVIREDTEKEEKCWETVESWHNTTTSNIFTSKINIKVKFMIRNSVLDKKFVKLKITTIMSLKASSVVLKKDNNRESSD